MATAAAATSASSGLNKYELTVFTTGAPRVLGSREAKQYEQLGIPTYRVTHRNDWVTDLPAQSFGYEHVGIEVYYTVGSDCASYDICHPTVCPLTESCPFVDFDPSIGDIFSHPLDTLSKFVPSCHRSECACSQQNSCLALNMRDGTGPHMDYPYGRMTCTF